MRGSIVCVLALDSYCLARRHGPHAEKRHHSGDADDKTRYYRKRFIYPIAVFPGQNRKPETGGYENCKCESVKPIPSAKLFIQFEEST